MENEHIRYNKDKPKQQTLGFHIQPRTSVLKKKKTECFRTQAKYSLWQDPFISANVR